MHSRDLGAHVVVFDEADVALFSSATIVVPPCSLFCVVYLGFECLGKTREDISREKYCQVRDIVTVPSVTCVAAEAGGEVTTLSATGAPRVPYYYYKRYHIIIMRVIGVRD
jgi:hypothetical protein